MHTYGREIAIGITHNKSPTPNFTAEIRWYNSYTHATEESLGSAQERTFTKIHICELKPVYNKPTSP